MHEGVNLVHSLQAPTWDENKIVGATSSSAASARSQITGKGMPRAGTLAEGAALVRSTGNSPGRADCDARRPTTAIVASLQTL